jgi:1,5-anhydro-D-fructose reductase (1,5-anhydro-D-mannitol-forming)
MRDIRWGIIGCGAVTEVKSGPGLQKAERSRLVAVMRRNASLAEDYARRHGVPRWYSDARDLLADPEVDAVYVATPPSTHREYARLAAAAGKPVYVEKPMARTHAECLEMIAACREAGVALYVAYYRRAQPRFLKVRDLLAAGAIGAPRAVTVTLHQPPPAPVARPEDLPWRLRPEISGGGLFVDLGSHTLDLLDYLLGPITWAAGEGANLGGLYAPEDTLAGAWRHAGGAHGTPVYGTGSWCFVAGVPEDRVAIAGSAGRISFATFADVPVVLETAEGVEEFAIPQPEHVQQPLIQTVVDDLLGLGMCPSTGESGARTSWVMDRMLAGYRTRA